MPPVEERLRRFEVSGFDDCRNWVPMLTVLGYGAPRRYIVSSPLPRLALTVPKRRYLRRQETQGHCEMASSPQEEGRRMSKGKFRLLKTHFECAVSRERVRCSR